MIRSTRLLLALALILPPTLALAKTSHAKAKTEHKPAASAKQEAAAAKPKLVGSFGAWSAYATGGKSPTCYVLAQPQKREPAGLKRDPAYVFISTRPAEHVRNEVSIIMGFDIKDLPGKPAVAMVDTTNFALVAKGSDLWLKDDSQGASMIAAMKKGSTLTVKAASMRGNVTTDTYTLSGLTLALNHIKTCK